MIFGEADKSLIGLVDKTKKVFSYLSSTKELYDHFEINLSGLKTKDIKALQNYVKLLDEGVSESAAYSRSMQNASKAAKIQTSGLNNLNEAYRSGIISQEQYTMATQDLAFAQKTATATTQALGIAMNVVKNIGITLIITATVKALGYIADKLIVTQEELQETKQKIQESTQSLLENAEAFEEDAKAIDELVLRYKEINASTNLSAESKNELIEIQNSLIDKFGEEAEGLDLLNGKYDENIAKIQKYSEEKYKEWQRENAADIARAERIKQANVEIYNPYEYDTYDADDEALLRELNKFGYAERDGVKIISPYELGNADNLLASLYVIRDVSSDISDILGEVEGAYIYKTGWLENSLFLSGDIHDAIRQMGELLDLYGTDMDEDTFDKLQDHYNMLIDELNNIQKVEKITREYESSSAHSIVESLTPTIDKLKEINELSGNARSSWFSDLKEMQEGVGKTVDAITSALQTLANGDALSSTDFWGLMELDANNILTDIQMVGDKFVLNQNQLITLKDEYIKQQIDSLKLDNDNLVIKQKDLQATIDIAESELAILGARGMANEAYRKEYSDAQKAIRQAKDNLAEYGDRIRRNNILIDEWNSKLGYTVDLQKQLETQQKQLNKELTALNKQLDNYQKAYETKIDNIIKGLEAEENELENQKQVLEDELDVLEKREGVLKETLDNYEKVNSYVQKIIDKEIEGLEEQRDAIKDTYDERIKVLQEENSEREDALDYAQKLANLENAKNNKRRVYDEARGWRYESVKEDVAKAESDLKSFETNQQVKKLEKERDAEIKAWDALIKKKEDYKKQWTEWLEELQDEESEALMLQYLGADAREKIANGDLELIETFSTQYRIHNNDLKRLTDTEIKLKKAEIEAKEADIKASKERIQAWKDYKQQFSTAVNDIKAANEEYMKQIGTIELDETSSLERRQGVFETFKNNVSGYIDQIGAKQGEIDKVTAALDEIQGGSYSIDFEVNNLDDLKTARDILDEIKKYAEETGDAILHWGDKGWAGHDNEYWGMPSHANGGVVNYTGVAMLHGSQQHPETIFNAKDSAKLYDMVHNTPNLMANMLSQAQKLSGFKLSSNENTTNATANTNIYIDKIVTDNPENFAHQLDRYYRTKLTESYTSRQ